MELICSPLYFHCWDCEESGETQGRTWILYGGRLQWLLRMDEVPMGCFAFSFVSSTANWSVFWIEDKLWHANILFDSNPSVHMAKDEADGQNRQPFLSTESSIVYLKSRKWHTTKQKARNRRQLTTYVEYNKQHSQRAPPQLCKSSACGHARAVMDVILDKNNNLWHHGEQ